MFGKIKNTNTSVNPLLRVSEEIFITIPMSVEKTEEKRVEKKKINEYNKTKKNKIKKDKKISSDVWELFFVKLY